MSIATSDGPAGRVRFDWISEAWHLFAAQAGAWVLSCLIYGIILVVVAYIIEFALIFRVMFPLMATPGAPPDPVVIMHTMMPSIYLAAIAISLASLLLNAYFGGGLLKMANKQLRGLPISVSDLFSGRSTFLPLVGYGLIIMVPSVAVGLGVYIREMRTVWVMPGGAVPTAAGIFTAVGMSFASYLIPIFLLSMLWPAAALIADGVDLMESLARSWNAVKGQWPRAFLFMLVLVVIVWVSSICGLGLLVTAPLFVIVSSLMYRDLAGMPGGLQLGMLSSLVPAPPPQAAGAWPPAPQYPPAAAPEQEDPPPLDAGHQ